MLQKVSLILFIESWKAGSPCARAKLKEASGICKVRVEERNLYPICIILLLGWESLGTKFSTTVNPKTISFNQIKAKSEMHNLGSSKHPKYAFIF